MSTDTATPTIDGKPKLLEFAKAYHPRAEHTIVALEKAVRRFGFELVDSDDERIVLRSPMSTTTTCRTQALNGGGEQRVRHLAVIKALELLLEVGVPLWASETTQVEWHLRQLEQCDPFQIPTPDEFGSREEMEQHITGCQTCLPSHKMLAEAISYGSSRYQDHHVKELIHRAHADPAEAVAYYAHIRDAHRPAFLSADKPGRGKKNEVAV